MVSESFFSANHDAQISDINANNSADGITTSTGGTISAVTSAPSAPSTATLTATDNAAPTSTVSVVEFEIGSPSSQPLEGAPSNCNLWALVPDGMGCDDFAANITEVEPDFTVTDLLNLNPALDSGDGTCDSGNLFSGYSYCISTFSSSFSREPRSLKARQLQHLKSLSGQDSDSDFDFLEIGNSVALPNDTKAFDTFGSWLNAYAMSPFLALNRTSPDWNGLSNLTTDLKDLLLLTNITTPSPTWEGVSVISQDWAKVDLDTCLNSYSDRYRASTGTVVMVVRQPNVTKTEQDHKILGIAYVSYNFTDLAVMCPNNFMENVRGGANVIDAEKAPSLPLTFGTFRDKSLYSEGAVTYPHNLLSDWNDTQLCPPWYPNMQEYSPQRDSIPQVLGCLSHTRGSLCRIGYNVPFFTIIIACLALRSIVILAALWILKKDGPRILTIGDAVGEFLENEDLSTKNCSLTWTPEGDWHCTNGPLSTYQQGHFSGHSNRKPGGWLGRCLQKLLGRTNEYDDAVPKCDVISYAHTMKNLDRENWFVLYLCTLGVVAGINGSIALQSGWFVLPYGTE